MINSRVQKAYDELVAAGQTVTHAQVRRKAGVSAQVAADSLREIREGESAGLPADVVEAALAAARTAYAAGAQQPKVTFTYTEEPDPEIAALAPLTDLVPGLREIQFIRDDGAPLIVPIDDGEELPRIDLEGRLRALIDNA